MVLVCYYTHNNSQNAENAMREINIEYNISKRHKRKKEREHS